MRSRLLIHSVLPMLFCLNSFVLFVAACMQTIPAEGVAIAGALDNAPLRRLPVMGQDDYSAHLTQFRAAKTFRSTSETASGASDGSSTGTEDLPRLSRREPVNKNAKTFAAKTEIRSETVNKEGEEAVSHSEPVSEAGNEDNKVHDDRDLFEALQVEKPDICGTCPPIWMKNNAEMKDVCSNHESVSSFFSMTLDRRDAKNVVDTSDLKECTRTITCSEPHMLVKWHESELCDVHAPYSGSLVTDSSNTFIYKCNGTQWTLHGFPLTSVVCAISSN